MKILAPYRKALLGVVLRFFIYQQHLFYRHLTIKKRIFFLIQIVCYFINFEEVKG